MLDVFAQLIPFAYIGFIIFTANQQAAQRRDSLTLRLLLYSMAFLPLVYVLLMVGAGTDTSSPSGWSVALVLALLSGAISLVMLRSSGFRASLRRFFGAGFDPEAPVHITALVLIMAAMAFTINSFLLSGGISGIAQSFEADSSAVWSLVLTQALWIASALLGVGMLVRRSPAQTAARLGVRFPTPEDFNWGLGFGLLSYIGLIAFVAVWVLLTSPEAFAAQTAASQQLASLFTSIPQALVLSLLIGIGEELFFRGAVQPIFGIWFTSIFFTVLHTQYTFTPATLALFGVSMVLGWLRQRHSTTTAIIAHFIYNFVQLALGILVSSSV